MRKLLSTTLVITTTTVGIFLYGFYGFSPPKDYTTILTSFGIAFSWVTVIFFWSLFLKKTYIYYVSLIAFVALISCMYISINLDPSSEPTVLTFVFTAVAAFIIPRVFIPQARDGLLSNIEETKRATLKNKVLYLFLIEYSVIFLPLLFLTIMPLL